MLVKIHSNSVIARISAKKLKQKTIAVTIGNHVFLFGIDKEQFIADRDWVCHELAHVDQYREYGFFKFLFLYLKESWRNGYANNRFEKEARNRENDRTLLSKYKIK